MESLPGQFDQRADSLAQCVALLSGSERPLAASAKVYLLQGTLSEEDLNAVRRHLINPVESREASADKPATLVRSNPQPSPVPVLDGFIELEPGGEDMKKLREELGLAMDDEDFRFLQNYFRTEEKRDPTLTEVRVIDTYWSDHCRHTTFLTELRNVNIENQPVEQAWRRYLELRQEAYGEDADRPVTLMDVGTIGARILKKRGLLPELDESEEINACSIRVPAVVNDERQDWLLMFKNETHNHPTEIEPFGGAATCIGGCIRDPLSGRAFVHQAMRVTGCADPRTPFDQTLPENFRSGILPGRPHRAIHPTETRSASRRVTSPKCTIPVSSPNTWRREQSWEPPAPT